MSYPIKNHPVVSFAVFVFGVLIVFAAGLDQFSGIWSFFSSTPPLQWFQQRWPGMTAETYWWSVLLVRITALTLAGWVGYRIYQWTKKVGPLEVLADDDNRNMAHRILLRHSYAVQRFNAVAGPYVILKVVVVNASVFTLTLEEKVEGKVRFHGEPLRDDAKVYFAKTETKLVTVPNIKHGQEIEVSICQPLPHHLVDNFGEEEQFELGSAALHFTYHDHTGEMQRIRIAFGNAPFVVKA